MRWHELAGDQSFYIQRYWVEHGLSSSALLQTCLGQRLHSLGCVKRWYLGSYGGAHQFDIYDISFNSLYDFHAPMNIWPRILSVGMQDCWEWLQTTCWPPAYLGAADDSVAPEWDDQCFLKISLTKCDFLIIPYTTKYYRMYQFLDFESQCETWKMKYRWNHEYLPDRYWSVDQIYICRPLGTKIVILCVAFGFARE